MLLTINIDDDKYPMLKQIKNIDNMIIKLLDIGYNIYFPKIEDVKEDLTQNLILSKLSKIELLENSLSKLIGYSNNSSKKGNIVENIIENIIIERYGDIQYEKKNNIPHSGDGWITLENNKKIIVECKNYSITVNKDEINKLEYDMIYNNIKWGLLLSFNSNIQGMKELDIITFIHNNENYTIITISNLSQDINKLDLGIQILRKLIINLDNYNKFPWVINDINSNLENLNDIISKNYNLRDQYYILEKDINKSLSYFYKILRDYQYELDNQINNIINKIKKSMEESIQSNIYDNINELYKNKKIYPILSKLLDLLLSKKCNLSINNNSDNSSNEYIIIYNNNDIGKFKIQIKKISIIFNLFDFIINLTIDNDKSNIYNMNIINNFIFSIL